MTVSRKPKPTEQKEIEANVLDIINRGGSVAVEETEILEAEDLLPPRKPVSLKIDAQLLNSIDKSVIKRRRKSYNFNRQQWIIEAIEMRLKQESKNT